MRPSSVILALCVMTIIFIEPLSKTMAYLFPNPRPPCTDDCIVQRDAANLAWAGRRVMDEAGPQAQAVFKSFEATVLQHPEMLQPTPTPTLTATTRPQSKPTPPAHQCSPGYNVFDIDNHMFDRYVCVRMP